MTCHHGPNDPECSKNDRSWGYSSPTPDSSNYTIEEVEQVGPHLVLMVRYPNCSSCYHEGRKTMVFLNTTTTDALRWKKIDPHFRDPKLKSKNQAPSPAARFPGTPEGFGDAVVYARGKE